MAKSLAQSLLFKSVTDKEKINRLFAPGSA